VYLLVDVLIIRKTIFLNMWPYILRFELQPFYFGRNRITNKVQTRQRIRVCLKIPDSIVKDYWFHVKKLHETLKTSLCFHTHKVLQVSLWNSHALKNSTVL